MLSAGEQVMAREGEQAADGEVTALVFRWWLLALLFLVRGGGGQ